MYEWGDQLVALFCLLHGSCGAPDAEMPSGRTAKSYTTRHGSMKYEQC